MSFHAGQMQGITGGVQRLRQTTKDGEVTLMRVGDLEFVDIIPTVTGGPRWEMVFNFPHVLADTLTLTLHFELKKGGVHYYFDVPIGSTTAASTYALYQYGEGEPAITTMYAQLGNIVYTATATEAPWKISCSLTLWDNKDPLTEPTAPIPVTGMTFICNYSFNASQSAHHWPIGGYVVGETYSNWEEFVTSGWLPTTKKYTVDVTMVNITGDLVTSIALDYLNNNYIDPAIAYTPSGQTTTALSPLTSIKDDYAYTGNMKPYINHFTGTAMADMISQATHIYSRYIYKVSYVEEPDIIDTDEWDINDPAIYGNPLVNWHPYWIYPVIPPIWETGPHAFNRVSGNLSYSYNYTDGGVNFFGSANFNMSPYEYAPLREDIITDSDNYSNSFSLNLPNTFVSTAGSEVAGYTDAYGTYTYTLVYGTITTTVVWGDAVLTASFSPIQLPAKNAKKSDSTLGVAKYIAYSAGTAGSPGL